MAYAAQCLVTSLIGLLGVIAVVLAGMGTANDPGAFPALLAPLSVLLLMGAAGFVVNVVSFLVRCSRRRP